MRSPLQVVRPDKVATTFPHAPDRAPHAQLVCIGFKDGAEVGMTQIAGIRVHPVWVHRRLFPVKF